MNPAMTFLGMIQSVMGFINRSKASEKELNGIIHGNDQKQSTIRQAARAAVKNEATDYNAAQKAYSGPVSNAAPVDTYASPSATVSSTSV